jgi:hypothetical protein
LDADGKHISTESLSHVAVALNLSIAGIAIYGSSYILQFENTQKLSHLRVFTIVHLLQL